MKIKDRYEEIIRYFSDHMPAADTELKYNNAYELLVAVILSAQCTDKRVNMITPAFFKKFPSAEVLSAYDWEEVIKYISSCSYPNNKARHLVGMARVITKDFEGRVPETREKLERLPGVGRKTANVILSVAFKKPAMAVDTHVFRVANRIGLTRNAKTPLDAELQLIKYIPEEQIHKAHHWLILHGRYVCTARKPKCETCGIHSFCNYYSTTQEGT